MTASIITDHVDKPITKQRKVHFFFLEEFEPLGAAENIRGRLDLARTEVSSSLIFCTGK